MGSIIKESKKDWNTQHSNPTIEELQCGAILRIADSVELLSKKYSDMESENQRLKKRLEFAHKEVEFLSNKNRGLKSYITRLKNKL